jgi:6-pyruvoyltetrahydropterin/6-carboxytetrahydropterin synthase
MHVSKEFCFESAHVLPRHPGKCSRLHGHSWRLKVEVHGPMKSETGFVRDYYDLSEAVQPIIDRFDHQLLNCFVRYPSSENLAIHIAHELEYRLFPRNQDFQLVRLVVGISETQKTWAMWDSAVASDLAMFSQDLAAEWRAPSVEPCVNIPIELVDLKGKVGAAWESFCDLLTRQVQLQMYMDSLGKPLGETDEWRILKGLDKANVECVEKS